jgi:hypothetical protein
MFWPLTTPLGKSRAGWVDSALIELLNLVYWKVNSFRRSAPICAVWLASSDWYLLLHRAERARQSRRAGAVHVGVLLEAVAHLQELAGVDVERGLRRDQLVLERRCGTTSPSNAGEARRGVDRVVLSRSVFS